MSSEGDSPDKLAPATAARPRSLHWRKKPTKLPPQYIDRQGVITQLAFERLGGREPAIHFLNTHHDGLGGIPIDLAGASEAGYAAVRSEVLRMASNIVATDA